MSEQSTHTRKRVLTGVALALLVALVPVAANAGSGEDYTKSPGYVDFEPILGDMESSIEVFLKGSLLVIAREAVRDDDPELGDLLSKIEYVRVQVFPIRETNASALKEKTHDVAKQLEKKGWEMTVRVREEGEQVLIYLLPGKKDEIQGVFVMAVEDGDEAVFINIVGDISPAEIGRIGRTFHLDSMDIPMKVEVEGDAKVTIDEGAKKHKSTD
jgi:hypothetical protein